MSNSSGPSQNSSPKTEPTSLAHILVVEDEEMARSSIEFILQKAGYRVTVATNGEDALIQLYLSFLSTTPVDLVLTDLIMPMMSGDEFISEIKKRGCRLPIVAVTGFADETVMQKIQQIGVEHILSKPLSASALVFGVARAMQQHHHHRSERSETTAACAPEINRGVGSEGDPSSLDASTESGELRRD